MIKAELQTLSDDAWARTRARLDGLTDEEFWWEPAPGCWTLRERDGRMVVDSVLPPPERAPFTTIAWRLWHLIDMYGEDRAWRYLGIDPQGTAVGVDDPDGEAPRSAAEALDLLDRAHDRWDRHLGAVDEAALTEPVGPVGGHYATHTRTAYVLHMLDEHVHHGAELGVLRDLWRWQHPVHDHPVRERIARGDRDVVEAVTGTPGAGEALAFAAAHARWEIVADLVAAGVADDAPGVRAVHLASGAGELGIVRSLLDAGTDLAARDPQFGATPREWADFLDRPEVIALLDGVGSDATGLDDPGDS